MAIASETADWTSAQAQLENALDQWQHLAHAEAEAIRHHDWTGLAVSQAALQRLQPEISRCLQALREPGAAHGGSLPFPGEPRLRARAANLLRLEQQNLTLLQAARAAACAEASQYQQATRALRRLRASYSPHPPAAWTSYS